jgi:glycerophosphoryl diester phosphodiesterase
MYIIGHRGASAAAPENTLAAFERAMADGADGVEFDVQLARDGVPVVIHDATLKRTGLREGLIARLSSIELNKFDVGTWFNQRFPARARTEYSQATIPTLAQVFDFFRDGQALLYVEMKCDAHESRALALRVAELITQYGLRDRAVVESFRLEAIREIKRIDEGLRTAALFEPKLSRPFPTKRAMIERALLYQADEIALHRTLATARTLEAALRHGMQTVVWTADHPSWIARAMKHDIHAIITNEPARLSARRNQLCAGNLNLSSTPCL